MSGRVLVIGIIAGVILSGLLACTIVDKELKAWLNPRKGKLAEPVFSGAFFEL